MIRYAQLLIQRDGRVWLMPERTLLGTVTRERLRNRDGWRGKCAPCRPWVTAFARTRRDAVHDLIEHWNEENGETP